MATTDKVKSFSDRAKEAGLPILVDRETIADIGPVTWTGAVKSQARNPQDGTMGDGVMATVVTDEGDRYHTFIGNVALLSVLTDRAVDEETGEVTYEIRDSIFPFRGRIVKSGRAWVFAD